MKRVLSGSRPRTGSLLPPHATTNRAGIDSKHLGNVHPISARVVLSSSIIPYAPIHTFK
jgi:hypothetical protein